MASLTFTVDKQVKADLKRFSWVNWSEVNREVLNKKRILEQFLKTGELSAEDQEFCDRIGWYPIDELEVREEYLKKLEKIVKGRHTPMSVEDLDKLLDVK